MQMPTPFRINNKINLKFNSLEKNNKMFKILKFPFHRRAFSSKYEC